jgi:hypothetical protein
MLTEFQLQQIEGRIDLVYGELAEKPIGNFPEIAESTRRLIREVRWCHKQIEFKTAGKAIAP